MRFVADVSLGGLAKWLRLCGFDTSCRSLAADPRHLPAPAPDTVILTGRQAHRASGRDDVLLLLTATPEAQLQEVLQRLHLSRRHLNPLSRCARCNVILTALPRESVAGRVPDYILHHHRRFYACPRCRRVYWPGSHLAAIGHQMAQALQPKTGPAAPRPAPSQGDQHES
jgi:uncharacterized protein with PIN domain